MEIRNNKIYFYYEGYENRFGQAKRPALVRWNINRGKASCSLYIDGKEEKMEVNQNREDSYLVILSPFYSNDKCLKDYNIEATEFNTDFVDDWRCLFHDTMEFQRMGDKMAFANLAIALGNMQINTGVILNALNSFNEEVKSRILGLINYIAFGLSISKIHQIKELNNAVGNSAALFFPDHLESAAKQLKLEYEDLCVHSLVDKLFEVSKKQVLENATGFIHFIQWLDNDSISISIPELETCFPFLGEDMRSIAIRRYFYDVKRKILPYNSEALRVFSSQNYQYYSTLRYVLEKWPSNRNVSTEFLLDCLDTYQRTNQQQFYVSDGILDWAIQKSIEQNRPIEMNFNDWLCYCQGGVVLNKEFQGFAEFQIQYELDAFSFEEDSLLNNINRILQGHCDRKYHDLKQLKYNTQTGEYSHMRDSKEPKYDTDRIEDNVWRARTKEDLCLIKQFVDLSKCEFILSLDMLDDSQFATRWPITEKNVKKEQVLSRYCEQITHRVEIVEIDKELGTIKRNPLTGDPIIRIEESQENLWRLKNNDDIDKIALHEYIDEYEYTYFSLELLKESFTYDKLEQYLLNHYGTNTPFISDRDDAELIRLFAYPIRMRASMNSISRIGINPGVDDLEVKERIKQRLIELFGESLECDYDEALYFRAQVDSQYGRKEKQHNCFVKNIKHYIYCAPALSDESNFLTMRKYAICQGNMCFMTSINKDPEWKELSLIHILEIIGYNVLEETEAGYIPNQVYNQFVNQINKAIRFYKRLTCRECGHVLFPAQQKGYTRFKCMLPACPDYNKEVYLNYCYDCKRGIIDSRDTKQCPNGLYICPTCNSCCSNAFFESLALKYQRQGRHVPDFISRNSGKGHKDLNMVFCHLCGTQKIDYVNKSGRHEWRCLSCHPIEENQVPPESAGNLTSNATIIMNGPLAFNSYGDVRLHFDTPIAGVINGKMGLRDEISISRGAFGRYLRENVPGYSAKCRNLAKQDKGIALVQRFFSVAIERATIKVTAHRHSAGDSIGSGEYKYKSDGYHYTIDSIIGIDERVIAKSKEFAFDDFDTNES